MQAAHLNPGWSTHRYLVYPRYSAQGTFRRAARSFEKIAGLISDFLASWHSVGYLDIVTLLPNRQRLLKDIEVSTEGAFRLVIIDCIDMPLAYEMARSLGMTAVENLLRNMVAELQIRLPLEGPLYAVAVGRFAFYP